MDTLSSDLQQICAIQGGRVFDGHTFAHADLRISSNTIAAICEPSAACEQSTPDSTILQLTDEYVIPGLVDIHFHGCMGADFSDGDPKGLHQIASFEAAHGVTAICPATMTFPRDVLTRAMDTAQTFTPRPDESMLVGINMEGPYISPDKVGAQNPAYVRPADIQEFADLQEHSGHLIKLVDVAPETPGALEFAQALADQVRISIAHTSCTYAQAAAAFDCGFRHMTHLYNAMPGLHHRNPGPIAAAAERTDVTPEIIADGIHIHPAMVRMAFNLFGPERMILISDTMRACGLNDGTYDLGGQAVTVQGARATIADGSLAGSVTHLLACLQTAVLNMDIPLEHAVRAATINPARAIGVDDLHGSLEPGHQANALILAPDLSLKHVVLRGNLLF